MLKELVKLANERLSGDEVPHLSPTAQQRLSQYDFPGNIRELRNILERALLLTDGDIITSDAIPDVCPRAHGVIYDDMKRWLDPKFPGVAHKSVVTKGT